MKKPNDLKIWLYESRPVTGLIISYDPISEDAAETNVTIIGKKGKKKLRWNTVKDLLDIEVDYNSIARIKRFFHDEVIEWKNFKNEHENDLAELERLKKKLNL